MKGGTRATMNRCKPVGRGEAYKTARRACQRRCERADTVRWKNFRREGNSTNGLAGYGFEKNDDGQELCPRCGHDLIGHYGMIDYDTGELVAPYPLECSDCGCRFALDHPEIEP